MIINLYLVNDKSHHAPVMCRIGDNCNSFLREWSLIPGGGHDNLVLQCAKKRHHPPSSTKNLNPPPLNVKKNFTPTKFS